MTTFARPENLDQYYQWGKDILRVDFADPTAKNCYDTNAQSAQNTISASPFNREFQSFLARQEALCHEKTGAALLMSRELNVSTKPYKSAVEKSFRFNVLRNKDFPNPCRGGWVTPENWYERFDDLVRSTLVCKFLDGPKLLAAALTEHAAAAGLEAKYVARSTEDGYYALHHYTKFPMEILDVGWQKQAAVVDFEIQLTTQLQEVLREITHPLYEKARLTRTTRDESWKWEHETSRFKTSYLGHTLHLIEAVILQVRDTTRITSVPEDETAEEITPERAGTAASGERTPDES